MDFCNHVRGFPNSYQSILLIHAIIIIIIITIIITNKPKVRTMQQNITEQEPAILEFVRQHGFAVFTKGEYNLNIIGVRNLQSKRIDLFDDEIFIVFRKNGLWHEYKAPITTDPGRYYLENTDYRQDGVAIMVHPQQCRSTYKIGTHGHTRYKALVQRKKIKIWRDNNHDSKLDFDSPISEGYFGINIHRSSTNPNGTKVVHKWSAGCQVFQHIDDFDIFMEICYKSSELYGDMFTYTLLAR